MLRTEEKSRNVFAKDMAYYVIPEILNHPGLAKEFNHVFLIRDPRKSIASYFRLDPDLLEEEVGLEAQWRLFRWISETTGREPQVLRAEDIQHDTQGVVGTLWQNLGLSFVPSAFSWQAGSMPDDWVEVSNWHDSTASHSVIEKDRRDDAEIQAEFDAVAAEAPFLTRYLEHHWPYYLELSSRALVVDS